MLTVFVLCFLFLFSNLLLVPSLGLVIFEVEIAFEMIKEKECTFFQFQYKRRTEARSLFFVLSRKTIFEAPLSYALE